MAEIPQTPAAAVGPLRRLLALACLAALAAGGAVAILGGAAAGALAAALACAVVVAVAGNLLLVRPMLRLAGSGHEVARTGQAMAGVAHDLRLAEWRQARLGAIAMGAGKVSHDLRGTLAPAWCAAVSTARAKATSRRRQPSSCCATQWPRRWRRRGRRCPA